MSEAALSAMRPVMFSGVEKLSLISRFSESRMDRFGTMLVVEEAVRICAQTTPAWESITLPPVLVALMELGYCARLWAALSRRYWPIIAQEPSAATLTRGSGLGEATTSMAKRLPVRRLKLMKACAVPLSAMA